MGLLLCPARVESDIGCILLDVEKRKGRGKPFPRPLKKQKPRGLPAACQLKLGLSSKRTGLGKPLLAGAKIKPEKEEVESLTHDLFTVLRLR
jgi:hypothetical protein